MLLLRKREMIILFLLFFAYNVTLMLGQVDNQALTRLCLSALCMTILLEEALQKRKE